MGGRGLCCRKGHGGKQGCFGSQRIQPVEGYSNPQGLSTQGALSVHPAPIESLVLRDSVASVLVHVAAGPSLLPIWDEGMQCWFYVPPSPSASGRATSGPPQVPCC